MRSSCAARVLPRAGVPFVSVSAAAAAAVTGELFQGDSAPFLPFAAADCFVSLLKGSKGLTGSLLLFNWKITIAVKVAITDPHYH